MPDKIIARGDKVRIITLGCKVNQYESERIALDFLAKGYKLSTQNADIVVINTCTVTSMSDRKSRKAVNRAIKDNPSAKVIVTGCSVELDDVPFRRIPGVTKVVARNDKQRIPCLFTVIQETNIPFIQKHARALLKVQDGCDSYCSYCVVPFVRGEPISLPQDRILEEARALACAGTKEINLTGINLGLYGSDIGADLDGLIDDLSRTPGIRRLRLSSIEVNQITDKMLEKMIPSGILCRHLHIPLQSGSNKILKLMNRGYLSAEFAKRIIMIRNAIPDIGIIFDVLVGFPQEEDDDFKATLTTIRNCAPAGLHVFSYSARPGTHSARMSGQVPVRLKKERSKMLKELDEELRNDFASRFIGSKLSGIAEINADSGYRTVITDNYLRVLIPQDKVAGGAFVEVKIDSYDGQIITGSLVRLL